ncbi:uncharacterized protein LOC134269187 [Saccostrea cucullata]|uniref:uncharacterized protein LOC134269187 n=1 Tax=Saccostrea cuccullata TaxID=36930 RepID=UPI002ED57817
MLRAVNTAVVLQICILLLMKSVFGMAQAQEYTVLISPASAMLNKGENLTALCNIPGLSALDIISKLKVRWYHNGRQLTSLCEFEEPSMFDKYACSVLSPQANNLSLEFTVRNVQKADAGNLTCEVLKQVKEEGKWVRDDLIAKKSVAINVRGKNNPEKIFAQPHESTSVEEVQEESQD